MGWDSEWLQTIPIGLGEAFFAFDIAQCITRDARTASQTLERREK